MQVDVRPWKREDQVGAWAVLREASFSNLQPSFQMALRRPITLCLALILLLVCFATGVGIVATVLWLTSFVALVYVCCLAATVYFLYGPNFNDMKHMESSYFANPYNHFWVAEAGGEVVGTIAVICKQHHNPVDQTSAWQENSSVQKRTDSKLSGNTGKGTTPRVAWLRRMAVKNSFRGQGIAKRLVRTVIDFCRKQGYDSIFLITTEVHQPARALYSGMGFKQKAFRPYKHVGGLISVWTYEFEMNLT